MINLFFPLHIYENNNHNIKVNLKQYYTLKNDVTITCILII